VVALALSSVILPTSTDKSDPVHNLARVRLIISTRAATADVTIEGATIASYLATVIAGAPSVRSSQTGQTLRVSRNIAGQAAEARFDLIVAGVSSRGWVVWNVTSDSNGETALEIYSLGQVDRPRLVDRFKSTETIAQFQTPAVQLASSGRLSVGAMPRLVLAHYYPWYTADTWRDPQMADTPLRLYSTDDQSDVKQQARAARAAGIDGFVVSWQGKEAGNGFNDRRMRLVLEAGRDSDLKACMYTETFVANHGNVWGDPVDPAVMFDWLTEIVDMYGGHPAYLRVNGRPVIFIYAASLVPQSAWVTVIARLRASGRNPLLIGDFVRSTLLEPFDGEYQYTNVRLSTDQIVENYRTESLRVRTYHLLRPGDRRRIWIAAVSPGYDDTRLTGREAPFTVDRLNGRVYDDQWRAAIDTGADWVIITSWNEWWENTEIEPGKRYGRAFLDRTRVWASVFRR
jgi:hypothetical protein